ncbi:hypothetical protein DSO57_1016605 [Entomophthora muscae]|uniref:Uncharacterized protein n=1 Tax=Entomophthora muscae TaxID=34485 RepID=A0ACC2SHT1_9FUNG|nr:hypothetical protein DSO57_1016605 [Entomophthora muscae]
MVRVTKRPSQGLSIRDTKSAHDSESSDHTSGYSPDISDSYISRRIRNPDPTVDPAIPRGVVVERIREAPIKPKRVRRQPRKQTVIIAKPVQPPTNEESVAAKSPSQKSSRQPSIISVRDDATPPAEQPDSASALDPSLQRHDAIKENYTPLDVVGTSAITVAESEDLISNDAPKRTINRNSFQRLSLLLPKRRPTKQLALRIKKTNASRYSMGYPGFSHEQYVGHSTSMASFDGRSFAFVTFLLGFLLPPVWIMCAWYALPTISTKSPQRSAEILLGRLAAIMIIISLSAFAILMFGGNCWTWYFTNQSYPMCYPH